MMEQNILRSSKKAGKYEDLIIKKLKPFFTEQGFRAIPHARFNISWGNIISDIDLLLIKEDKIGIVEVKSSRDNLKRAKKQISSIKDYVDFAYVATDFRPRKLPTPLAGWILVENKVTIMKYSQILGDEPSRHSVHSLPKKCLEQHLHHNDMPSRGLTKYELADNILSLSRENFKYEVKTIATCGSDCDVNCPIWKFEGPLVPKPTSK